MALDPINVNVKEKHHKNSYRCQKFHNLYRIVFCWCSLNVFVIVIVFVFVVVSKIALSGCSLNAFVIVFVFVIVVAHFGQMDSVFSSLWANVSKVTSLKDCSFRVFSKCICHCHCLCICICLCICWKSVKEWQWKVALINFMRWDWENASPQIGNMISRNTVGENQEIHLGERPPEKVANPRGARLWAIVTTFVKEIYFSGWFLESSCTADS